MLLWIIKFHISFQFFMVLFGKLSSYLYNCLFRTLLLFISYLFLIYLSYLFVSKSSWALGFLVQF